MQGQHANRMGHEYKKSMRVWRVHSLSEHQIHALGGSTAPALDDGTGARATWLFRTLAAQTAHLFPWFFDQLGRQIRTMINISVRIHGSKPSDLIILRCAPQYDYAAGPL